MKLYRAHPRTDFMSVDQFIEKFIGAFDGQRAEWYRSFVSLFVEFEEACKFGYHTFAEWIAELETFVADNFPRLSGRTQ